MLKQAVKVRLYPNNLQELVLAKNFGCARWWWNRALNTCIDTYKATGKGLSRSALNSILPGLKKEHQWLGECYSQVLQSVTLNLVRADQNFFEGRAKYPRFKSKFHRQSIQYPQNVKQVGDCLKFPGQLGLVKAVIHRLLNGKIKTVTVSQTPSGKYYASVLMEYDSVAPLQEAEDEPTQTTEGKVIGIDLGVKDFAVTHDGEKTSKYNNPKHLAKHEKNVARKQKKLARKQTERQQRWQESEKNSS